MTTADPSAGTSASLKLALGYLHQHVRLVFDRPAGSHHPVHGYRYPINYGHIPGTLAPDGDELDAYYLGTDQPLSHAHGTVIAVIHRLDDDDDKIIVVANPAAEHLIDSEISAQIEFQERPGHYIILRSSPKSALSQEDHE
jgi:inorganic pyrophosphatase